MPFGEWAGNPSSFGRVGLILVFVVFWRNFEQVPDKVLVVPPKTVEVRPQ
jgi:hypothetical protein